MENLEQVCTKADITIKEAIKLIDQAAKQILIVLDDKNRISGVVTDGDIRRWILKNGDLNLSVTHIINTNPVLLKTRELDKAQEIMQLKKVQALPVVNDNLELQDIIFWNECFAKKLKHYEKIDIPVVIMAGGKGTRLQPYTNIIPKPLIPINNKPIVERIIGSFHAYGCKNFHMTLHYMKNMIKAYFEDTRKDYSINFIEEEKPLGTAGSLQLLKGIIDQTFIVNNCDILIEANYADIIKHHRERKNKITLVTSMKNYVVPYGIIEIDNNGNITRTEEKPEINYLVNTGFYVLEPEVLDDIPEDTFFHITDLINNYLTEGQKVGVYPVSENSWMDMGQMKEMEKMMEKLNME